MTEITAFDTQAFDPGGVPLAAPWREGEGSARFFEDDEIASLQSRAIAYLRAGVPVHFEGPAGMGKTTLALRIAAQLGRPVTFITGDKWITRAELVGREIGQTTSRVDDQYIASVRRTETRTRVDWKDAPLSTAMAQGHTLIYDEFTRTSADANATLLSVLEERMLVTMNPVSNRTYLEAHPEFRVILTSNPQEYAGVSPAPDALLDRIVTFNLDTLAPETECGIVACSTGLPIGDARRIVHLMHALRGDAVPGSGAGLSLSIRTAILIGRLLIAQSVPVDPAHGGFLQICTDVLRGRIVPQRLADVMRRLPGDDGTAAGRMS